MPGPVPKRPEERTRRNATNSSGMPYTKGQALPTKWPGADRDWEKPVRDLWNAMKKSGQAAYAQQTDIAMAWIACDELNDYRSNAKASGRRNAELLKAIHALFDGLLLTEVERRKAAITLEPPAPEVEDEKVVYMNSLKEQMKNKKAS